MSKFFVGQYVKHKEKDGEFIVTKELSNGNYDLITKWGNGTAVEVFENVLYAELEPVVIKTLYTPSYAIGRTVSVKGFSEDIILSSFDITNDNYEGYHVSEVDQIYRFPAEEIIGYAPSDPVNHPPHYTSSPIKCGNCDAPIECIDVTRHFNFNLGNTIKYIWRADHKGKQLEDLKKARWYLDDLIEQLESVSHD